MDGAGASPFIPLCQLQVNVGSASKIRNYMLLPFHFPLNAKGSGSALNKQLKREGIESLSTSVLGNMWLTSTSYDKLDQSELFFH